jgi:hypothetical protein
MSDQIKALGKIDAVEEIVKRLQDMPERAAGEASINIDEVSIALGIERAIAIVLKYGNEVATEQLEEVRRAN